MYWKVGKTGSSGPGIRPLSQKVMDERYEHIEQYLKGELEKAQQEAFEKEIQADDQLAAQVEFYRQAMESVALGVKREQESADLSETLNSLGSKYFHEKPSSSRPLWLWMGSIAAVIVLLVGVYFGIFRPPLHERLYHEFVSHEDLPVMLSSSPEAEGKAGIQLFNQGEYAEALPHLETLYQQKSEDFRVLNAIGICQLELGQFGEAQASFTQLIESSEIFRDQGQWYLALVYLKQGELEKCKVELENLAGKSGGFQQKAEGLLGEIE